LPRVHAVLKKNYPWSASSENTLPHHLFFYLLDPS
jgi:hypothetical protein